MFLPFLVFRMIYHCPFCNLCRVGKGLGIDFFHCMTCNCCLGMKLVDHKCREKGLETNCPICCDFLFTSSTTVRALPCGHFMHSACFQVYQYICSSVVYLIMVLKRAVTIVELVLTQFYFLSPGICMHALYLSYLQQVHGRYVGKRMLSLFITLDSLKDV